MWKYLLIAIFVLLAIREINLMNQSLYLAPDNKLVAEDKTTASELKKLITKIRHNEFLIKEPETIQETNKTSTAQTSTELEIPSIEQVPKPYELIATDEILPWEKETNTSTKNIAQTIATPYTPEINQTEPEQNNTQLSATAIDKTVPVKQTPPPKKEPLYTPTVPNKEAQTILQQSSNPTTTPTTPQPVTPTTEPQALTIYPKNFKSAEERVRKILEEMKAQR